MHDQDKNTDTYGQSQDIDDGQSPVPDKVPE
jgi:hypothetical protein